MCVTPSFEELFLYLFLLKLTNFLEYVLLEYDEAYAAVKN